MTPAPPTTPAAHKTKGKDLIVQNTQRKTATWRTKAALTIGLTAVAALAPSTADAAYTCAIGFDSYWSLAALLKKACDTFAPNYTQACGTDSYTFTPSKYGHFHLSHQNPCYGACLASDSCMPSRLGNGRFFGGSAS